MKILSIDDHPAYLDGIEVYFQKIIPNVKLNKCYDANDALSLAKSDDFDIILLDHFIPNLDGLDILRIFEKNRIFSPVLVISSIKMPDDAKILIALKNAGAVGFVSKSEPSIKIVEAIHNIINTGEHWTKKTLEEISLFSKVENFNSDFFLSKCEKNIVSMIEKGYSNKKISFITLSSINTVKSHIKNIYKKMDVKNRTECASKAKKIQS